MLKYTDYDIVFQEIPDEVTLAVNLSGCPNRCPGCHSPQLQQDVGAPLTTEAIDTILDRYKGSVTCVCLMGGDADPQAVTELAEHLRRNHPSLQIGWYSGRPEPPAEFRSALFDYLKLGPYVAAMGGLRSPATNQQLWRLHPDGSRTDLTVRFRQ